MALTIDDILSVERHEFWDFSVVPDDTEFLVVLGNCDVPHEEYSVDVMKRALWRVRVCDGTGAKLTDEIVGANSPCWSPDGKQVAFLSRTAGSTEIWVMDKDARNRRQLTCSEGAT